MTPASFSLDVMLTNLSNAFGSIQSLIVAISYVIGVALVARGVMMYSVLGRQTMSSAQRGELAGPMVHIVIGALLIYFPSTLYTSLQTVFGTTDVGSISSLVAYSQSNTEKWQEITTVIVEYMRLIGLIAFVRGWIILSKMGHAGAQPGSIGKGLVHVIGGILLVNIVDTVNILAETFGYTGG